MLFERIESKGLAHWSYLIGDEGRALVIDPRLDAAAYIRRADAEQVRITDVLETHRNEDYLVGSVELAARTGARIWHADSHLSYGYGRPVSDGQRWDMGAHVLKAIHTPGHTPGSMSYLLHADDGEPWMLFCGDLLFAGEVGRTDLGGPGEVEQYAAEMHRSIAEKVLPLGDAVILCPAHGSGSACGGRIADRSPTTIGVERKLNPLLSADENDFIRAARETSASILFPPYFHDMEQENLEGSRFDERLAVTPLTAEEVASAIDKAAVVLDTREIEAYAGSHVPAALAVPSDMLGQWAGWFLGPEEDIVLVSHDPERDRTRLARTGFDRVHGYLAGGMLGWEKSGRHVDHVGALGTRDLCALLDEEQGVHLLDVRSSAEVDALEIPGAQHIHLPELLGRMEEVPTDRDIVVFCGSGLRSTIAASLLERSGRDSRVVMGGTAGWSSVKCPLRPKTEPVGVEV